MSEKAPVNISAQSENISFLDLWNYQH